YVATIGPSVARDWEHWGGHYRTFDLWLPLAIGVVLGRAHLRRVRSMEPSADGGETPPVSEVVAVAAV
ncbi:MAG: hypothetical protein P8N02_18885, partial [Actinomycetota bacterium]|nr:hypothetical protein [Actinomycetota bacterium]